MRTRFSEAPGCDRRGQTPDTNRCIVVPGDSFIRRPLYIVSLFLWGAALLAAAPIPAQNLSPSGLWRTIDDKTHKTRGLVRIFEKDGAMFGRIEASFDPKEAQEVCGKCEGDRKNKPVIGLVVMRDMKKRGSEYSGGDILDPDTGSLYRCRMTLEDGGQKLNVRGYVGLALLGRSQTWIRQE